jgi:hypothetical protein
MMMVELQLGKMVRSNHENENLLGSNLNSRTPNLNKLCLSDSCRSYDLPKPEVDKLIDSMLIN